MEEEASKPLVGERARPCAGGGEAEVGREEDVGVGVEAAAEMPTSAPRAWWADPAGAAGGAWSEGDAILGRVWPAGGRAFEDLESTGAEGRLSYCAVAIGSVSSPPCWMAHAMPTRCRVLTVCEVRAACRRDAMVRDVESRRCGMLPRCGCVKSTSQSAS